MADIPERDWRAFRELREIALERFCERVLREITDITSSKASSWHQRYGAVFELLERRDDELARAFNGPSRSKAIFQLAAIYSNALLTQDELERFTPETRERLKVLAPEGSTLNSDKRASKFSSSGRATRARRST
jgi:hypothetical protein